MNRKAKDRLTFFLCVLLGFVSAYSVDISLPERIIQASDAKRIREGVWVVAITNETAGEIGLEARASCDCIAVERQWLRLDPMMQEEVIVKQVSAIDSRFQPALYVLERSSDKRLARVPIGR